MEILCLHGPIYRVLVKCVSLFSKQSTQILRNDFIICLIISLTTIFICIMIHTFYNIKIRKYIAKILS